jgi:glutamate racemase
MLKIVVFDSGYGGELFADCLKEELPVVEIIRVIDWRNTDKLVANQKTAREVAEAALRPYIDKVDLIIFANHLLSLTSLKYFQKKYKNQKFLGFNLEEPSTFIKNDVLILTTKALSKTISYHNFIFRLKRKTKTLTLDDWIIKIDDGELSFDEIRETILRTIVNTNFHPKEVILGCAQFNDIKNELYKTLGWNIKIYDSFADAIRRTHKTLHIRGGMAKK